MPFDSTPGGASANSFLSVEEAESIAAQHPFADAWIDIPETADGLIEKQALLIEATKQLNRLCYLGSAVSSTQALQFPRDGLLTRNGYALATDVNPWDLKLATFEMALSLKKSGSEPASAVPELIVSLGLTRVKAGPIDLGFREGLKLLTIPENVKALLVSSWLCPEPKARIVFEEL